jgi:O-methyltransferase involved in polyketide biosynthesis
MALAEKLNHTDVNAAFPTLVLSECVLVYLKPEESKVILSFFRDYFKGDLALLNYEMINPHDPFGKTMLENLEVKLLFP